MVRYAVQLRGLKLGRLAKLQKLLKQASSSDRTVWVAVDVTDATSADADADGFVELFTTQKERLRKSHVTEWVRTESASLEWTGGVESRVRFRVMLDPPPSSSTASGPAAAAAAAAASNASGAAGSDAASSSSAADDAVPIECGRVEAAMAAVVRASKQHRLPDGSLKWYFDAPLSCSAEPVVSNGSLLSGARNSATGALIPRLQVRFLVTARKHHYEVHVADRYVLERWAGNLLPQHAAAASDARPGCARKAEHRPSSLVDEMFANAKEDLHLQRDASLCDPLAVRRAAYSYIADALAGFSPRHRSGDMSVRIRFLWIYSSTVRWLRRIVVIAQLALVLFEAPTFEVWRAPFPTVAVIETILLGFHCIDALFAAATDRRGCCARSWNTLRILAAVTMLADIAVATTLYLATGLQYVRPTRVLRAVLAFIATQRMLRIVENIFSTFRKLVSPLAISLACTALYAFVGTHLFAGDSAPGRLEFNTFSSAFRHLLFAMWGSVNFPDVRLWLWLHKRLRLLASSLSLSLSSLSLSFSLSLSPSLSTAHTTPS